MSFGIIDGLFAGAEMNHSYNDIHSLSHDTETKQHELQTGKLNPNNYDPRIKPLVDKYNSLYGNHNDVPTAEMNQHMNNIRDLNRRITPHESFFDRISGKYDIGSNTWLKYIGAGTDQPMTDKDISTEIKRIDQSMDPSFIQNPRKFLQNHGNIMLGIGGGLAGTALAGGALYSYLKNKKKQ